MSYLKENVIPGNYGKIFGTDAKEMVDIIKIKKNLLKIDGIREVVLNEGFPKQFTVHTTKVVPISAVENAVSALGFHAVPKSLFPL